MFKGKYVDFSLQWEDFQCSYTTNKLQFSIISWLLILVIYYDPVLIETIYTQTRNTCTAVMILDNGLLGRGDKLECV